MSEEILCPFSKPIIGQYCSCPHARLAERCSGKMRCERDAELRPECEQLVDLFRQKAHFVLSISSVDEELTHAQSMKIRCGGLLGMQRILQGEQSQGPDVREMIEQTKQLYASLEAFPYSEIMPDIQGFNHRRKLRKTT